MTDAPLRLIQLLREDGRYKAEAYFFVRDSLSYAHDIMKVGGIESSESGRAKSSARHVSGQQLCEAMRRYALEQYGYLAKLVLNSWGIYSTSDFGELVFNLIRIGMLKKSETDRREDFDDVFDFEEAFQQHYQITMRE